MQTLAGQESDVDKTYESFDGVGNDITTGAAFRFVQCTRGSYRVMLQCESFGGASIKVTQLLLLLGLYHVIEGDGCTM